MGAVPFRVQRFLCTSGTDPLYRMRVSMNVGASYRMDVFSAGLVQL